MTDHHDDDTWRVVEAPDEVAQLAAQLQQPDRRIPEPLATTVDRTRRATDALARVMRVARLGVINASISREPDDSDLALARQAVQALAEAGVALADPQGSDVDDLRWLVGHLIQRVDGPVALPPRLVRTFNDCRRGYDPSRFTLASTVAPDGTQQEAAGL